MVKECLAVHGLRPLGSCQILHGLSVVFRLDLAAVEPSPTLERDVSLAADAGEWTEDQFAGVAVEPDQPVNHAELQRADVLRVFFALGRPDVERVGLFDVAPRAFGPVDPLVP